MFALLINRHNKIHTKLLTAKIKKLETTNCSAKGNWVNKFAEHPHKVSVQM